MAITLNPPPVESDLLPEQDQRTRRQPPYAVIVYNDDDHTVDYVVNAFSKVFKYELKKCVALAMEIHERGRAIVWVGSLEVAELKKEQIEGMGKDMWSPKQVNYPLKVELEPLP